MQFSIKNALVEIGKDGIKNIFSKLLRKVESLLYELLFVEIVN